ncbi:MAG: YadA C-terminal domain-containing protein [Polaromonas sp.]|nr:YadA C-terminal domain-containing protein [Polaromonas sp.]
MRPQLNALSLAILAATAVSPAFSQQAFTLYDDGTSNTIVYATGVISTGATLIGVPYLENIVVTGVAGEESGTAINGRTVESYVTNPGGNRSSVRASQTGAGVFYSDPSLGITSGALAVGGASYIGTYDMATTTLQNGLYTDSAGNVLFGATDTAGISNTGGISTDTLSTTGNASAGGNLSVSGSTTTNGIVNTGLISTTSLSASGAVSAGTLSVSGATTTSGIVNTGNISSTTLTTSGNATVGGNLAVTGIASTNGINNNGQVISGVANGIAATDAVNVGQLNTAVSSAVAPIASAQAATNTQVQNQLSDNRRVASTGSAIAMAAAAIPALEQGKNFGVGVGGGTYDSRGAFAIGVAARVNQALQVKLNVGTGNGGKVGAGAAAMWSW